MTILLAAVVDTAILLGLALAAAALLRRRSAALRHAIVAVAIIAAALTPALELLVPQFPLIRWGNPTAVVSSGLTITSDDAVGGSSTEQLAAGVTEGMPWTLVLLIVWAPGALVMCAGLATGLVRLARLRRRCTPADARWRALTDDLCRECGIRRPVAVMQSDDPSFLVTCGVLKPVIILPVDASRWTDDRIRVVLRHELAHIVRHDALIQLAAETLRTLHWLNPLVWIACRRLRQESEYACDDAVLSGGVQATDYAAHLLDVARQLNGRHLVSAAAPAIAHPSTLERRIAAMLHRERNRTPVGPRGWSAAALVVLAITLPLAAAGVVSQEEDERGVASVAAEETIAVPEEPAGIQRLESTITPTSGSASRRATASDAESRGVRAQPTATIAGTVLDQTGGAVPGARLTLTDTATGVQTTHHTDAAGRFAFRELHPVQYELVVSQAGFTSVRNVITVAPVAVVQRTITLPIGSLSETVTVACAATPILSARDTAPVSQVLRFARHALGAIVPVLAAQQQSPAAPIRVGGNVRAPRKLTHVSPVCPPTMPPAETTVRLMGRIGVDGFLNDVAPLPAESGVEPPMELTEAALTAVRQWIFTPTLLNGVPVEVNITVKVVFTRS